MFPFTVSIYDHPRYFLAADPLDSLGLKVWYSCSDGMDESFAQVNRFIGHTFYILPVSWIIARCKRDKMVTLNEKETPTDGQIMLQCIGGCLEIISASYSCEEADKDSPSFIETYKNHNMKADKVCHDRDKCTLKANSEHFKLFEGCESKS